MIPIHLHAAYGRQPTLADWFGGKDFLMQDGPYCSIRDADMMLRDGYTHAIICTAKNHPISIPVDLRLKQIEEFQHSGPMMHCECGYVGPSNAGFSEDGWPCCPACRSI